MRSPHAPWNPVEEARDALSCPPRRLILCEACPLQVALKALAELVRLKDISDQNNGWVNMTGNMAQRDDYNSAKPLAWKTARAIVKKL